jgi:hypothetical protein
MKVRTCLPEKTAMKLRRMLTETISLLRKEMLENRKIPDIVADECLKLKMCRDYRLSFKKPVRQEGLNAAMRLDRELKKK